MSKLFTKNNVKTMQVGSVFLPCGHLCCCTNCEDMVSFFLICPLFYIFLISINCEDMVIFFNCPLFYIFLISTSWEDMVIFFNFSTFYIFLISTKCEDMGSSFLICPLFYIFFVIYTSCEDMVSFFFKFLPAVMINLI